MGWLVANMKWVMLVSGALTLSMLQAAIAPDAALLALFGETIEGPLAETLVRNWGALVSLVGAMLVYGAFHAPVRRLALVVAGLSKLVFIALLLNLGDPYLQHQAGLAIVVDAVVVLLFAAYLFATRRETAPA